MKAPQNNTAQFCTKLLLSMIMVAGLLPNAIPNPCSAESEGSQPSVTQSDSRSVYLVWWRKHKSEPWRCSGRFDSAVAVQVNARCWKQAGYKVKVMWVYR